MPFWFPNHCYETSFFCLEVFQYLSLVFLMLLYYILTMLYLNICCKLHWRWPILFTHSPGLLADFFHMEIPPLPFMDRYLQFFTFWRLPIIWILNHLKWSLYFLSFPLYFPFHCLFILSPGDFCLDMSIFIYNSLWILWEFNTHDAIWP